MLPPIPYADLAGYKRRSPIVPEDIDWVASKYPGYLEHRIAVQSAWINARLKKRYAVPLGQEAPTLVALGTAPPAVTLAGVPRIGTLEIAIQVTTPGIVGVAVVQWTADGGESWTTGVVAAASVTLGTTGLSALFPAGSYGGDNLFTSSTPVPASALGWLVALVDVDLWMRRGTNPQDPLIVMAIDARERAAAEIKEAADSKDGLFDLPTNDVAGDSAVTQGGPLSYSEPSPYVWTDIQRQNGRAADCAFSGDSGGVDTP
jgi:hypothetical protein